MTASSLNRKRLLLAGLLAGLVINVLEFVGSALFMEQAQALFAAHDLTPAGGPLLMALLLILGFVTGIVLVWFYVGARCVHGPGPATALRVAVAAWVVWYVALMVAMYVIGLYSLADAAAGAVWGLLEICLATLAGAWFYRQD